MKTEDRGPKTERIEAGGGGGGVSRRDVLKAAAMAPLAFAPFSHADAALAAAHAMEALQGQAAGAERSGSATDAGVPEFMDFICIAYPDRQPGMRDGLRWLDGLAYDTYHKNFANCSDTERRAMLDQIAWPAKAKPEMREGVQFFNRIRDFTASGFFSSQMGVKDIGYMGNTALPAWHGCPKPALDHIGVRYS